ncbi:hypothetical protein MA16_Dca024671 [Dendrobium catenatum]|uniref:Uncharacterized protein n=1 Tax=Dendrobium catenatum TaxID=906689 RepID=A0A2I0WYH7_9ASPA|nr:hypothetical protein MA16_Dca024671 [Dendrobium catenatum]
MLFFLRREDESIFRSLYVNNGGTLGSTGAQLFLSLSSFPLGLKDVVVVRSADVTVFSMEDASITLRIHKSYAQAVGGMDHGHSDSFA